MNPLTHDDGRHPPHIQARLIIHYSSDVTSSSSLGLVQFLFDSRDLFFLLVLAAENGFNSLDFAGIIAFTATEEVLIVERIFDCSTDLFCDSPARSVGFKILL